MKSTHFILSLVTAFLPGIAFSAPMVVVDRGMPTLYIEPLSDLPNAGLPTGWTLPGYDVSQDNGKGDPGNGDLTGNWQNGFHGVGYGDYDDNTLIEQDGNVYSVYTRTVFQVADASSIQAMTFEADYDDGYIVWLNGVEVCRSASMNSVAPAWNASSTDHEATGIMGTPIDISSHVSSLVNGDNVLAIGSWNNGATSSDLTLIPRLTLYDTPYLPPPLHIYLTYQDDPSTTITVNYQTGATAGLSTVYYDIVPHGGDINQYPYQATGSSHQVPGLNAYVTRNIHWVPLSGLLPDHTYYFVAGDPSVSMSPELKFRTIPSGDSPIRFVVGGDMAISATSAQLHRQAAACHPMFAWMTGDMAVCDGNLANWTRWDTWLSLWETNMVTPDGHMVPMLLGIGNHEVNGGFDQTADKAPFYFGYFAQEPGRAYFSRRFGQNLSILVLDSGHISPVTGDQSTWIASELSASSALPYRFVGHHVPMYPSDRAITDSRIAAVRTNWMSLWDQYKVTTAFEGHDHVSKRTRLMRADNPDPLGTLHLGDGYGTQGLRPPVQSGAAYLEHIESKYHLWLVEVPSRCVPGTSPVYTAIDENGLAYDRYSRKINSPTTILAAGSTWKYLVTAADPGATWKAPSFDDSTWPSGPAEMGYGDGDEATVIGFGPDANNKYPTTYFRTTFDVTDPSSFAAIQCRILRDDGAIIYLNGQEIWRSNLPATGVTYATYASANIGGADEATFYFSTETVNFLSPGLNTLAVEIHQSSATSTDLSFNLELQGFGQPSTLVSKNASWKYLVTAAAPSSSWNTLGFDDTAWPSGNGRLGFGGDGETTVLGYGPDINNKYPTTYFRKTFAVADKNLYRAMGLRITRDDGAVVYLNGAEIYRSNMPQGIPAYATLATAAAAGADETFFFPSSALFNLLRNGNNTLAVEVHQNSATSSDLGFHMEFFGISGPNTLYAEADFNGSITPAGEVRVNDGLNQSFSITPSPGHHIADVIVDCQSVGPVSTYTFNSVTENHRIHADFDIDTFPVICVVSGNGACTASPSTVNYGSTADITVIPDPGWHLVSLIDSVDGPQAGGYTTSPVYAARTVTATFAINTYEITCVSVGNGSCSATPPSVQHGSTADITVIPDPGWHLVSLVDSVDGPQAGGYTTSPVYAARTVTATFAINTYEITCVSVGNGFCSATPPSVPHGSTADITVIPDPGWHLVSLVDSVDGPQAGGYTTSPVYAARTVTATFAINTYEITCVSVGNGSCSASPPTVQDGATCDITVNPDPGWRIVSVLDSVDGSRAGSYTTSPVHENRIVTAEFSLNPIPPVADFTASPTEGHAPLVVQFADLSSSGSSQIDIWNWDFGDGTILENDDPAPIHSYANPGIYTVQLEVISESGSDHIKKDSFITVMESLDLNTLPLIVLLSLVLLICIARLIILPDKQ